MYRMLPRQKIEAWSGCERGEVMGEKMSGSSESGSGEISSGAKVA